MTTSLHPTYTGPMRLDAYRVALELARVALPIAADMPRGFSGLASQLRRSCTSVPLNLAEGYGRHTRRAKAAAYATARGEALEVGAILDVLAGGVLDDPSSVDAARPLADRVARLASGLVRRFGGP